MKDYYLGSSLITEDKLEFTIDGICNEHHHFVLRLDGNKVIFHEGIKHKVNGIVNHKAYDSAFNWIKLWIDEINTDEKEIGEKGNFVLVWEDTYGNTR